MLLNLLQLLQSDDQTTYTDKVNYNFDQILSMGGGPIGPTGFQGIQGVPGSQGIQGFQGPPGMDGTKWYVQPSSNIPTIPTPQLGDLWLQTDTLQVWAYLGSPAMWVNTGNVIASTGVFTAGGANNLLYTSPSPTRSLVLSAIPYGIGNDSQGGTFDYKLKVVGPSGTPLIRLAVEDTLTTENTPVEQTKLKIQKFIDGTYPGSINWAFQLENLNGDVEFALSGNNFKIYPQIASVSRFDFGAQVRLQNNAADRLLSFSAANTGFELFHIGRHAGLVNNQDKIFSIKNNGQISFGNSFGNAFSDPFGASNYHIDSLNDDLDILAPAVATINWARFRGRTALGGGAWDALNIQHKRLFPDSGGPTQRSTMIKLQHNVSGADRHFIGFSGGADSATGTLRPTLRFGYVTAYYMSADQNGRIAIGDHQFNVDRTQIATGILNTKLTVQGNTGTYVPTNYPANRSGIHLAINQTVSGGVDAHVGITAGGLGADTLVAFAGIHFQDQSSQPSQGVDIHFGTGLYGSGGETRRSSILRNGDHYWYSKNAQEHFLFMEPGTIDGYAIDLINIGTYDTTSGQWKSIIFNRGTETSGLGDGFVGIGATYGELVNGSIALWPGEWYVALTNGARTITPIFPNLGFPYSQIVTAGEVFQALAPNGPGGYSDNLDFGTVAKAKPQTKFQVNDSVTFGTRSQSFYSSIGAGSFTVGNNHTAIAPRSIILGGLGHTISSFGDNSVIIGYSGIGVTLPDPNKVLLATTTHVNTSTPSVLTSSSIYTAGDPPTMFSLGTQYNVTGGQILQASSAIQAQGFWLAGQIGRYASVLTLEGRTDNSQLAGVRVGMEYHIKNSSGIQRILSSISSEYFESSPGIPGAYLSFAVNMGQTINGTGVGAAGGLAEVIRFGIGGITFVRTDPAMKAKITALTNPIPSGAGQEVWLMGGAANQTGLAAVGGGIRIEGGQGYLGGANGSIGLGTLIATNIDLGVLNGIFGDTPRITLNALVTHAPVSGIDGGIIRADKDFTTGTDTPGWATPWSLQFSRFASNPVGGGNFNAFVNSGSWANWANQSYIHYKIIGKTAFVQFICNGFNNNQLGGTHRFALLLPPALQNLVDVNNYPTFPGVCPGGETTCWYTSSAGERVIGRVGVRKYVADFSGPTAPLNGQWIIHIDHFLSVVGGTQTAGGMFSTAFLNGTEEMRGTLTLQLL